MVPLRSYLLKVFCKEDQSGKIILDQLLKVESLKEEIKGELSHLREDFLSSLYELENNAIQYFSRVTDKLMEFSSLSSQKYISQTLKNIQENGSV